MEPDAVGRALEQANQLLEAGKAVEALRILASLNDRELEDDERVEVGALTAWALSDLERGDESLALLDKLLDEFPESARLLATRGVVCSNLGDLETARSNLEQAIAADASDGSSVANLALVCERLREYDHALELYERAIELGADIDWVLQRRSAVFTELGDLDAARRELRRYLSLAPDDAPQWVSLAILFSDDDRFEQALECYRAAEAIDPNLPALRLNWGVTAVRSGDLLEARRQLRELERVAPGAARTLLLQAFLSEEHSDGPPAAAQYEIALQKARGEEHNEHVYALEMAMDYFARCKDTARCKALLIEAYASNACTVELCEAFRKLSGAHLEHGAWFSILVEADVREAMIDPPQRQALSGRRCRRYVRNLQVIAKDHDDALAHALAFVKGMGETGAVVREFVSEEPIDDEYAGIYEVEADRLYLVEDDSASET